jgi:2-polyprenyl-3-methyl-5-hydroxy-6-metoxy-1,4-benzoquinol methylase
VSSYDDYYQDRNYFGNPYPELIEYFKTLDRHLKIIDLGCGQGRDTLALGRLGFHVTGVDISKVGIDQMNDIAKKENLDVSGIVEDYQRINYINAFDVVLMDSMFHFYKKDIEKETEILVNILNQLKVGGRFVTIMQKNIKRVSILKNIIKSSKYHFKIEHEQSFIYHEFNSEFYMISIIK